GAPPGRGRRSARSRPRPRTPPAPRWRRRRAPPLPDPPAGALQRRHPVGRGAEPRRPPLAGQLERIGSGEQLDLLAVEQDPGAVAATLETARAHPAADRFLADA